MASFGKEFNQMSIFVISSDWNFKLLSNQSIKVNFAVSGLIELIFIFDKCCVFQIEFFLSCQSVFNII